jgi:hypothetical protein
MRVPIGPNRIGTVTSFYTIDSANARIPEVREILLVLRAQREELIRLRDRLIELQGSDDDGTALDAGDAADRGDAADDGDAADSGDPGEAGKRGTGPAADRDVATERPSVVPAVVPDEETRLIRLRMQGVVDQMQASVAKLDGWSIVLRDIDSGLIDFPALASGRQIWLCWRLGENDIVWWHDLDVGFSGRRSLGELA